MPKHRFVFTVHVLATLRELFEDGLTQEQIAEELGCSTGAVSIRIKQLGLERRRGRSRDKRKVEVPRIILEPYRPIGKYDHLIFEKRNPGMNYADYLRAAGITIAPDRGDLPSVEREVSEKKRKWNKGLFARSNARIEKGDRGIDPDRATL